MKRRYYSTFFVLLLNLYAATDNCIEQPVCKDEFNISDYWHDGMTWEEFNEIRNGLQRKELIKYVDKIESQKIAQEAGLEVPKTYIASREKVPFVDIISNLPSYVAKMTHLSFSKDLIIVRDGINTVTGQPIKPEEVQEAIFKSLENKPRSCESWALHNVQPGFMVQEYISARKEMKIQTIWGKAVIGELKRVIGEEMKEGESKKKPSDILARFDRDGNVVWGDKNMPMPKYWPQAVEAAELMAQGTDALRVDFLIRDDGVLLFNESEIWPETDWSVMKTALEENLNNGYQKMREGIKTEK